MKASWPICRVPKEMLVSTLAVRDSLGAIGSKVAGAGDFLVNVVSLHSEASFALSVKNPEASSPAGAGLRETENADYLDRLPEEFRGRRFAREDVRLLDFSNAEFILIGAGTDPERAYDLDLESPKTAHPRVKVISRLHLSRTGTPIKSLFEGVWE
jgi:hypothetical protein